MSKIDWFEDLELNGGRVLRESNRRESSHNFNFLRLKK